MEITEDEIIQKYGQNCRHCNRNTLLPYEYEYTCFSCGYNVIKRKHELSKVKRKKNTFYKQIEICRVKNLLDFCVDVYKRNESNDYDERYEVLSTLKNKKLIINNISIEKYRDMLENPDFEQNKYSLTSTDIYKIAHDSIRTMKWIFYSDRSYYENINYYDLMGSVCRYNTDIT